MSEFQYTLAADGHHHEPSLGGSPVVEVSPGDLLGEFTSSAPLGLGHEIICRLRFGVRRAVVRRVIHSSGHRPQAWVEIHHPSDGGG